MSKRAPYPSPAPAPSKGEPWPGSPRYWRSLEERAKLSASSTEEAGGASGIESPEFPAGHTTTPPSDESLVFSRRGLLGAMAATFALVGAEGCRRPVEKIVPYTRMPEDVIPGVPSHYATVIARRGDAAGLLVECHEGRPTKIEGNPEHTSSYGAADQVTQATILELYDPERSQTPRKGGAPATWEAFEAELAAKLASFDKDQGTRLRLLMPPTLSPTVLRMRAALAQRFPKARVHTWAAVNDSAIREGSRIAFGEPASVLHAYERAKIIVSLDSDFLQTETSNVRSTKLFSNGRRLRSARDAQMNRLYVVEPALTTTGANADHRLRLPASDVERFAYALAAELGKQGLPLADAAASVQKRANADGIPAKWLTAVARDLLANKGRAVVIAGSRQPAAVHALALALTNLLGTTSAVGQLQIFLPVADPDELDVVEDIKALADAMGTGRVEALVILGGNPVYDAPADLGFKDKLAKVPFVVHSSLFVDETSSLATWHLPRAHEFESWGDARSVDSTVSIQQPLIAPLYAGRSDIELLGFMAKAPEKSAYDAVRRTALDFIAMMNGMQTCGPMVDGKAECRDGNGNTVPLHENDVEAQWGSGLSKGFLIRARAPMKAPALRLAEIAAAIEKRPTAVRPSGTMEVTFAACPKMVDGRFANNTWLQEAPDSVTKIVWDNAAILSPATAKALGVANKDMITIAAGGRSITAGAWIVPGQADGSVALTLGWGRTKAGRIGNGRGFDAYPLRTTDALGFAAAQVSKAGGEAYFFAQTQEHNSAEHRPIIHEATLAEYKSTPNFSEVDSPPPRSLPLWSQRDYSQGHQWGMTIDLTTCTGCSACLVACIAENNVPVVGKLEVWRGREMHWLRVDRYYIDDAKRGASEDDPIVVHEPVMCVHCEEAPCENVCPVNATTHGPEGLNEMAYNRCIGTRYCANNCPYKVRKFNYLNWHNDVVWKDTNGLPETLQMQQNPNVTVRFRGVMEKCSYCVQRIQSAKIKAKREYREVHDGEIRTACQQTCPADAIVFGDLNDPKSLATKWARVDRRFGLLAELGTRPRTTYLGKVRNPNPEMA